MSFQDDLINSKDSKYSAYLSFISGRGREGFRYYAFVEDDDDIEFYQHIIEDIDVSFLGCGGKSNVLAIYERVSSEGLCDECWFFVDRDHEIEPLEHRPFILRTYGYSWENHCLDPDVLEYFLVRKINPMPNKQTVERFFDAWNQTFENFSEILSLQIAIIRFAKCKGEKSEVAELVVTENLSRSGIICLPCPSRVEILLRRINQLSSSSDEFFLVTDLARWLSSRNLCLSSRGKTGFLILRSFFQSLERSENISFRVQTNSPLNVIKNVPSNLPCFDYIREYAKYRRNLSY